MSGGSFDYLCCKEVSDLIENDTQLEKMEKELFEMGYQDLANETKVICEEIQKFKQIIQKKLNSNIREVWHAVEWFCSGDFSREQVDRAIRDFRRTKKGK